MMFKKLPINLENNYCNDEIMIIKVKLLELNFFIFLIT
jgi:hypothetical protein